MSSFKKGQQVIHCRDGLAVIVDETLMAGNSYFIVRTIRGAGENIYVPIDRADQIIRVLMTEKEAEDLISYIKMIKIFLNSSNSHSSSS